MHQCNEKSKSRECLESLRLSRCVLKSSSCEFAWLPQQLPLLTPHQPIRTLKMTLDDSEQVGRTLQYLYRIKQEHKFIAGRLDATLAAQNATQETLKELMARLAQVERQSSQVADETNQCRQACATANAGVNRGLEEVKANIERQCLKTKVLETNDHEKDCRLKTFLGLIQDVSQRLGQQEQSTSLLTTGMNRGLEEAKAHIERQCLKTKVLETNDHEKDGRLKTFLGMIQDVSQRLGQQEQSTALLLKSKGKLTKKHDDHDWESQVVNLKTENQGMRGELEAVKMQSGQLATDFKKLQEEMRELKRERSENLATQVQDASTIATVLVPRSQPEETQEPEMTQEKQQSPQPAQTRKRTRTVSGVDASVPQSQPTEAARPAKSPRNRPEATENVSKRPLQLPRPRVHPAVQENALTRTTPAFDTPAQQSEHTRPARATQPHQPLRTRPEAPAKDITRSTQLPRPGGAHQAVQENVVFKPPQISQSSQSQGHVYVRRSPRNHPECQSLVEPRRASRVSSHGDNREKRSPEKRLRGTEAQPQHCSQDSVVRASPVENQATAVPNPHAQQNTMSLRKDPKTQRLIFRYADTQHARERIESIFARPDPTVPSTKETMQHHDVHNPRQLEMTKKAHSKKATGTLSSPRKRKSSAGENTLGGSGSTAPTGQDGSLSMNQGYPRLDQRRKVETRRSTRLETQTRTQTQEANRGLASTTSAQPKNQQPEQDHRKQTGQGSHAQSRPTKRKKRYLPVYDLPALEE
ncbi:hypothetical protein HDK77DRAFT_77119 [Phyllosticta capitalensis]